MIKQIIERPENQKIWVVRASGGDYIPHFRQGKCIAIGHIDEENQKNNEHDEFFPNMGSLQSVIKNKLRSTENPSWKHRASSHYNQVRKFIAFMEPGDLVVSMDRSRLIIGRITGHPYISNDPIVLRDPEGMRISDMSYELRRNVSWGPSFKRSSLPAIMQRSINARQTVFNIDRYWSDIYHLIYPIFKSGDELFFSTRIEKKDDISNYDITKLFSSLSYIEILAKSYDTIINEDFSINDAIESLIQNGELSMSTVAEFMSPGSVWSKFKAPGKTASAMTVALMVYGAIFGIETPAFKTDGIIDLETRHKIIDIILSELQEENFSKTRERLKLEAPNYNTTALENASSDSEPSPRQETVLASLIGSSK